jgi:hypothetical protein
VHLRQLVPSLFALVLSASPAVASAPRVFVPDFHVYPPDFTPSPATPYSPPEVPRDPWYSLAIAPNGDVYYPDQRYGQIRFDHATQTFSVVASIGQQVATPRGPQAVGALLSAVDPKGRLYTDGGHGILGNVSSRAASSVISTPNADEDLEFSRGGRLYSADPGADAGIEAFDDPASQHYQLAGRFLCQCDLHRIAVDVYFVYVVDTDGTIYQLTPNLSLVRTIDTQSGTGAIQSLAPDPDGGVWFADRVHGDVGYVSDSGIVKRYVPPFSNRNGRRVDLIATAGDGTVWFMGDSDTKLVNVERSGRMIIFPIPREAQGGSQGIYFKGTYGLPDAPSELAFQDGNLLVITGV